MGELNGRPVTVEEALSLGLTNYGHYTSFLVEEAGVRGLSLHLDRLATGTRRLFGADLDTDAVRGWVVAALTGRSLPVVARVTVFDPHLDIARLSDTHEPAVLVTFRPAPPLPAPAQRLRTRDAVRDPAELKHTATFGALLHRRAAQQEGYDDVLFTNPAGNLTETATANIVVHDGRRLIWPRAASLPGVTMTLLQRRDPGARREPFPRAALGRVQAAAVLNSVVGVRAVRAIDDTELDPGHPVIAELRAAYEAVPHERL